MIAIPLEREHMSNAQAKVLLVELAEHLNAQEGAPVAEMVEHYGRVLPLDEDVLDRMEDRLAKVQETRSETPKWGPGRIAGNLTNRQGIQQNVGKLTAEERREIMEDQPDLLDSVGK